jgi:tetratricopeptide (TPR) repeat protein
VYQPSDQVRFALEGAVAYVREGIGEADIALGKEQARLQAQEHAGRETLFRTLVQQGDQAYAAGNFEDALNRYKAASTILPDVALVHSDLGAVYQVLNKLPEAEAAYRLAIELDGSDLDSAFNLAQVLEQSGRLPEALKLYKQVLERRPQDAEAKEHATRLSQKLGQ